MLCSIHYFLFSNSNIESLDFLNLVGEEGCVGGSRPESGSSAVRSDIADQEEHNGSSVREKPDGGEMSSVLLAKCVSIAIIFGGSLICGLLPAFRVFASFPRFALSLTLSYGGGILIATSLVHILPEARQAWPESKFSAEMSLCMGIFIVYVVEEVAHFLVCHDLHSPLGHSGDGDGHNHGVHVHHDEPPNRCDEPAAVFLFAEEKTRSGEHGQALNQNSHGGKCGHGHGHSHSQEHHNNHSHGQGDQGVVKLFPVSSPEPKIISADANRKDDRQSKTVAKLRSLVGLVALSVHAGLEGLSVGLGRDASDVWYLCGAVAAHKLVIAFCLGMEVRNASANACSLVLTSSSASFKFRYVLFFAAMTPLGIAIGTIITELVSEGDGTTESTLVAVLQTLASGTLLYVAFFEVILRERARFSGKGLYQLLFVILGWSTMVLVEVLLGAHDHSHPHHGDCHDHETNMSTTSTSLLPSINSTTLLNDTLID